MCYDWYLCDSFNSLTKIIVDQPSILIVVNILVLTAYQAHPKT